MKMVVVNSYDEGIGRSLCGVGIVGLINCQLNINKVAGARFHVHRQLDK